MVRPELVAEIQFTAWSGAGRVRRPVYLGLREEECRAGRAGPARPGGQAQRRQAARGVASRLPGVLACRRRAGAAVDCASPAGDRALPGGDRRRALLPEARQRPAPPADPRGSAAGSPFLVCRTFAEAISQEEPHRFLPTLSKRRGRILIDYLRNGLGNTAIGSFCPRERPGATVAMPLAWAEVKPGLDPAAFTIRTVPDLLRQWKRDPWDGFREAAKPIPELAVSSRRIATAKPAAARARPAPGGRVSGIVVAHKPRKRG